MTRHINVTDDSTPGSVPVRRRNTQGRTTVAISITVPIELNNKLESEMAKNGESKSLIAVILMEEALAAREQKG